MNDRRKRNIIYLIVFIFIFVMIITVSTYCYFITKDFYYGNFNVEVNTKGVDTLQMKNLVDANLNVNDRNFIKDVGHSISGTSSIDVVLDTTKKETKYCYNVYLSLPDNEIFSYSNYPKPELSLSVYETNNNEKNILIDNIDITKSTGKVDVPSSLNNENIIHNISTTKNKTNTINYEAVITFNYFPNIDQSINGNLSYKATLVVDNVYECK